MDARFGSLELGKNVGVVFETWNFNFGVLSNILTIIGIRASTRALKWFKPHGSIFISKKVMNFLMLVKTNEF